MSWRILPASAFPDYQEAWAGLNAMNGRSPLLDFAFVDVARRTFSRDGEVLGICEEGDVIKAMGLFTPRSPFVWHTFQPANAPLGAWLCLPGEAPERPLRHLIGRLPGFAALLAVTQQDPEIVARPAASASLGLLDYIRTPRLTVSGPFAAYWQTRGKNLRHNIQRQHNRLKREALSARFERVTEPALMRAAVDDYAVLESNGWKGREKSAVTPGGRQARFYAAILEHYAQQGCACVWRYFLGDRLAASNLSLERDGTLIVLKTAYEEGLRNYSPAQLMHYEAFRQLYESGRTRRVEFYGPVKDWHTKWTGETRTMYHLNVYRWPWLRSVFARVRKA